jgi:predicted RNA-binding Zn-ribbon protein involved in translation (DUF1610 family)
MTKYDNYGTKLVNDSANVSFDCPNCGETEINRSRKARELGKEYTCSKCNFTAP